MTRFTSGVNSPMMQQGVNNSPMMQQLFKSVDAKAPLQATITKGSLITFNYSFWAHDPYPMVIVSDVISGNKIRGINLHYLTFNYVSNLLKTASGNPAFSYSFIKNDTYIASAFRSYKWQGIRNIRKLDSNFILSIMGMVRSFDINEIEAIRKSVQQQMNVLLNPPADTISNTIPAANNTQGL